MLLEVGEVDPLEVEEGRCVSFVHFDIPEEEFWGVLDEV